MKMVKSVLHLLKFLNILNSFDFIVLHASLYNISW